MLNFVALGLLFSSLGAVMVLTPEPGLVPEKLHPNIVGAPTNEGSQDQASSAYPGAEKVVDVPDDSASEIIESFKSGSKHAVETLRDSAETVAQKVGLRQEEHPSIDGMIKENGNNKFDDIEEKAAAIHAVLSQKAADAGGFAVDRMEDSSEEASSVEDKASQNVDTVEEGREPLKKAYEEAKQGVRERVKETISYMPCVGEGVGWSVCQGEASTEEKPGKIKTSLPEPGYDKGREGAASESKGADSNDKEAALRSKVHEFCQWFHNETISTSKSTTKSYKEWLGGYYNGTKERVEKLAKITKEKRDAAVDSAKHLGEQIKGGGGSNDTAAADMVEEQQKQVGRGLVGSLCSSNWTGMERMKESICKGMEGVAATVTRVGQSSLFRMLYLFNYSLVYGVSLWVTFVSGYLLSQSVPRHQFGFVQSKIFPFYLRMLSSGIALCLLLHSLLHPPWSADTSFPSHKWQYWSLLLSLAASLLNTFVLEPTTTKVMFEKLKLDKEEGRGQASLTEDVSSNHDVRADEVTKARILSVDRKFKTLHGYSSFLNLVAISGLTWHLWYLSKRLVI